MEIFVIEIQYTALYLVLSVNLKFMNPENILCYLGMIIPFIFGIFLLVVLSTGVKYIYYEHSKALGVLFGISCILASIELFLCSLFLISNFNFII